MLQGDHYRITVLADGLLRLEYSADGGFEDRASALAMHRDLPVPQFRVIENEHHLEIRTDRVQVVYNRGPFSTSGLSIQVRGNISSYHSIWRFGDASNDMGGTARTLDMADGAVPLESGVVSRWGYALLDDSATLVLDENGWVAPRDGSRIDLYFFGYGHDYPQAVQALYSLAGPTPLLPRYALGNWWSRYHRYTAAGYIELLDRFAAEGIPFTVAVVDMDWHLVDVDPAYGSGWTGYSWNTDLFPDPADFLRQLHEKGLRITLNVHPADGVRAYETAYPEMARALGIDPASGDPIAFDVTDQEFLRAYFDILHRSLERDGVDFWWIDWQSGPHSRIAGIDPLWMLNHFHFLDSARDGKRPLTFSRYAGPGSHRYPVGFSGDTLVTWASLDFQPYFTATASNIGYGWWSHDIGGHMFGAKDEELATRWLQFGVFSPILRLNSGNNPFNTKEPWRFGADARASMTDALRLRHRLLPYLYSMNHRAARDGAPLVQPMYWSHPEMPDAYQVPNQYTFGTELVVAPITSPRDTAVRMAGVNTWLPAGRWIDLFTGLSYAGDRRVLMFRDLSSIPVLAKAGAIIPMSADQDGDNGIDNPVAVEILVVVGADGRFELIEDDGTGSDVNAIPVASTPIRFDQAEGVLTVEPAVGNLACVPATRDWTVTFLAIEPGRRITATVDGAASADPRVLDADGGFSVVLTDVPVSAELQVSVGAQPRLAPVDVRTRLFDVLDRAHIEFELKGLIHRIATADRPLGVWVSHLQALELPAQLSAAVSEILLADDRTAAD